MAVGQPDRPRPVHPLQCLHRRLPRGRDRLQLPGRPERMQEPPRLRAGLRVRWCHRLPARTSDRRRALRPGVRPARSAGFQPAPASARLFSRRCRSGPAGQGRVGAARAQRRVRQAALLQLQAKPVRAQPQPADRLHRLHRRLLGTRDPQRRLAQRQAHRQESRRDAWRTGVGRPTGTRRRRGRRAALVRGLWRLQHGLPQRGDELCLPRHGRPRQASAHDAHGLRQGWWAQRCAAAAQPGGGQPADRRSGPRGAQRSAQPGAWPARCAGPGAAGGCLAHRERRSGPVAGGHRPRREPGLAVADR